MQKIGRKYIAINRNLGSSMILNKVAHNFVQSIAYNQNEQTGVTLSDKQISLISELYKNNMIKIDNNLNKPNIRRIRNPDFSLVILQMTNSCNLNCSYCFIGTKRQDYKFLSFEDIITTAKKIFYESTEKKITFEYHGGEPLLFYDIIRHSTLTIKRLAAKFNKKVRFSIITNGTLIDQEKIDFFKKHRFGIGISQDGPRKVHDKNRRTKNGKGSYDAVVMAINLLKKNETEFGVISTFCDTNKIISNLSFLEQFKLSTMKMNPVSEHNERLTINPKNMAISNQKQYSKIRLKQLKRHLLKKTKLTSNLAYCVQNAIYGSGNYGCMTIPCSAGRALFSVGPGGDIFPCHSMAGDNSMIIGNIREERPIKQIFYESSLAQKFSNRSINDVEDCKDCSIKMICGGGGCPYLTYLRKGSVNKKGIFCDYYKYLYYDLFDLVAKNKEQFLALL